MAVHWSSQDLAWASSKCQSAPPACWLLHPLSLGLRATASPAVGPGGACHTSARLRVSWRPAELGAPSLTARLSGAFAAAEADLGPGPPRWMQPCSQLTLWLQAPPRSPAQLPFLEEGMPASVTVFRQAGGPSPHTASFLPVDAILGEGAKRPLTPWRSRTQALKWSGHYGR